MKAKDTVYGIEVDMSYHPNLNGLKEITQDTWDAIIKKHGTDGLDLQGCLFRDIEFETDKFANCNFSGSTFQGCWTYGTEFNQCNFKNVQYLDCKFTETDIRGSNLSSAYFSAPNIVECLFVGNDMTQSFFRAGEIRHTVFETNDMNKSYWDGTNIETNVIGRENQNTGTMEIAQNDYRVRIEMTFFPAPDMKIAAQAEIDALPDPMIGLSEMKEYGYTWEKMLPLTKEKALELFENKNLTLYQLHEDGTESLIENKEQIMEYDGIFGIEKDDWNRRKMNMNAASMDRQENGNLYLNTPDLSGRENKEYRDRLKEAGAKYDLQKQDWYLPEGVDPSKGQAVMNDIIPTPDPNAEPIVTIISSQYIYFRTAGEIMSLSEANSRMGSYDKEALEAFGDIAFKTKYRIDYIMNGNPDYYVGEQLVGDGSGALIDHIEHVLQNDSTFVPYLKMHDDLSKMEQIATKALQENEGMTSTETSYHTAMQEYVSRCRTMVNQGNYDMPPVPQLKDFEKEEMQLKEEKNMDAASNRQENGNLYLETPDLSGRENKEYREQLKAAGAKYDPEKQDWYLPEGVDPSKGQAVMNDIKNNWQPKPEAAWPEFENMQPYFKAFAYAQGHKKPYVVYGNSKEEILGRLNSYNQTRPNHDRFQTCNIGQLDAELNSYQDFHKYNMEGKDISNIYLQLPHSSREEFLSITKQLKEAGAKFNPVKKQWYISGDADLDKFKQYLPEEGDQKPIPAAATQGEDIAEAQENNIQSSLQETAQALNQDGSSPEAAWPKFELSQHYTIAFADGRDSINVPIPDGIDLASYEGKMQMTEKLYDAISNSQPPASISDSPEYRISQPADRNSCTIYFNDGQDPIELNGAEFGMDFSTMSTDEVSDFTKQFIAGQKQEYIPLKQFEVGDKIDCFVSTYEEAPDILKEGDVKQIFPIGTEPIKGTVESYRPGDSPVLASYEVRFDNGMTDTVYAADLYTKQQAEVIQRAVSDRLPPEQLNIMFQNSLSPAQMEEIRFGLKDGLTAAQVESYADPKLQPAQMDICRYALQHGVGAEDISKIIASDADWIGKRQAMDQVIKDNRLQMAKDFKKQGFSLNKDLVKKMETLNHLTHRSNSLKDVCQAFKQGIYKDDFRIDNIVKEVGHELQIQEAARQQAMLAAQA